MGKHTKNNVPIFIFCLINWKRFLVIHGLEKSTGKKELNTFKEMLFISAFDSMEMIFSGKQQIFDCG